MRGNSVYFPDRVVPMLPERISNDLCSLRGGEDRPALAVRMVIGADGVKRRHSVPPGHDALEGQARLRAGAGGDRRLRRRDHRAPAGARSAAALGRLRGPEGGARRSRAARPRPARTQGAADPGRRRRPRRGARPPRRAPAHRGVHDPRQRRGGRDPGGCQAAADLPRPRRARPGEDAELKRGARLHRHQVAEGGRAAPRPVQPHPRPRCRDRARPVHQRGRAAQPGAGGLCRARTSGISG